METDPRFLRLEEEVAGPRAQLLGGRLAQSLVQLRHQLDGARQLRPPRSDLAVDIESAVGARGDAIWPP